LAISMRRSTRLNRQLNINPSLSTLKRVRTQYSHLYKQLILTINFHLVLKVDPEGQPWAKQARLIALIKTKNFE
jgi:hypothetical protein